MQRDELRRSATAELQRRRYLDKNEEIPSGIWQLHCDAGHVEDAELKDFEDDAVDYIVEKIQQTLREARQSGSGTSKNTIGRSRHLHQGDQEQEIQEITVQLDGLSMERAQTFSWVAALRAAKRPDVEQFREEALDGKLLSHEQANELLESEGWPGTSFDSPLAKALHPIGKRLAADYHWREKDAIWFVLTGYDPPVRPLQVAWITHHSHFRRNAATIRLIIEPWVSAEEVERAYRDIQRQARRGKGGRPVFSRNLEILRFVEERTAKGTGKKPSLSELCELWNRTYPKKRLKYKRFVEAYQRTERAVMDPDYGHIRWGPYERTPAQASEEDQRRRYFAELKEEFGTVKLRK